MTKKRLSQRKNLSQHPDLLIALLVLGLVAFGLIMVFDASVVEAYNQFGDKFFFLKKQAVWAGIGFFLMSVITFLPISLIKKNSHLAFGAAIALLFLVLIPGVSDRVQGARRWISLMGFTLQPSELAKLATVVYLPSWLVKHQRLGPFLILLALLLVLIMLEPDMGTAIVITGIAFCVYFISGAAMKHILAIGAVGLALGLLLIIASPYRRERLLTFINPTQNTSGSSYHIRQVLIGIGSGGLTGTGIGRSRQKYQYLPEATTDSIFAVIGEEIGFIGSSLVLLALLTLIMRSFQVTLSLDDHYLRLLASGVSMWITLQTVLNLSAMVALIPLTGVPLPFVSYGGSALISTLMGIGLLLNVSRFRSPKKSRT